VAAALVDFLAGLVRRKRRPFRNDSEVGSASSARGRVSVIASFIVSTRTM